MSHTLTITNQTTDETRTIVIHSGGSAQTGVIRAIDQAREPAGDYSDPDWTATSIEDLYEQFNRDGWEIVERTTSFIDTPDLMVPAYIRSFERLDTVTGLNCIMSLKSALTLDPAARVMLRSVADIQRDNEHPQNKWRDVAEFLARLHPEDMAVVIIRS